MPNTRLVKGGPLLMESPYVQHRAFIKEIVDEDCSGVYYRSGIHGCFDTDNCNGFNNEFNNAIR